MKNPGDIVTFVDEHGHPHNAIVTAYWGEGPTDSLNLVHTSSNPNEKDDYGRQTKRQSSVPHKSRQSAAGMYWE